MYRIKSGGCIILVICALLLMGQAASAESTYNEKWAVLIGITDYKYLVDLYYPVNDIQDMRSTLIDQCGFSSDHIFIYTDSQATRAGIRNAITLLSSRTGNGDLVVFYYSGHGTYLQLSDQTPLDEADGYDETICPYDALSDSFANDITDDELQAWLSSVSSRNTVCIFDSCGSGGMTKGQTVRTRHTPVPTFPGGSELEKDGIFRDFARDINSRKFLVLMAADDDEDSWDISNLQNGLFTYYLVEGLCTPTTDTDRDTWISMEEAFNYAKVATVLYKSGQNPQMFDGDRDTEIDVAFVGQNPYPTPTATPVSEDITGRSVTGYLAAGGSASYSFDVPEGASLCKVSLEGPVRADFDLYVRRGEPPSVTAYDARSSTSFAREIVSLQRPAAGRYYVLVTSYSGSGSFTISESNYASVPTPTPTRTIRPIWWPTTTVTATPALTPVPTPTPTRTIRPIWWPTSIPSPTPTPTITPVTGFPDITRGAAQGYLNEGDSACFRFDLAERNLRCRVNLDGPSGTDFDLFVKKDEIPGPDSYDLKGSTSFPDESVTMYYAGQGRYYVTVQAVSGSGSFRISESH